MMVGFQKKGGPAAKRGFPQVNEKIQKKKGVEVEEDDDDSDDDIDMDDDDSDFDDSDSDDASDSGGKLNAKGKQTPTQGKGSSLIKTPKGQAQTPTPLQKQGKQNKMEFSGTKGSGKKKMIDREAVEDDDEDDSDDDDDDDDDDASSGKLNAKGKQTTFQAKGSPFIKSPKGQAQTPASGKMNQLSTPLQKQGKQSAQKQFPGMKGPAGKGKILGKEHAEDDDDDDDDDDSDEDDDDDDDSDSADASGGKLNVKGKQTLAQVKGSSLIKTPKGQVQTPALASGKKSQLSTPLQKQGRQNALKEFPGMKGSAGKGNIMAKKEDDSDDDDDDDDDDSNDDEVKTKTPPALSKSAVNKTSNGKKDMHVSFELPKKGGSPAKVQTKKNQQTAVVAGAQQGKPAKQNAVKGATGKDGLKGKKRKNAESDEDDDDDDDDDLSDEEEEEDDDDDDDDDAESDEDEAIKKKVSAIKKEMKATDAKSKNKKSKNLPESEGELKANKPVQSKTVQESLEKELERKRERDARNLFIRGLPTDITVDEIKALSPDILNVTIPKSKLQRKKNVKSLFGFIEFASEKKADENYVKLQKKKLRGQEIFLDYSGEKSKNKTVASATVNIKNIQTKKLYASGLPTDVTMAEVAQLFPHSYSITLNNGPEFRSCSAAFHTEEDAAEAFKANEKVKVRGRSVTVLYAIEKQQQNKRKGPGFQNFQRNKFAPPHKRMKREM